ncbi:hypothetical protein Xen7305DRAFT_00022990 [Xenococcus sp. PCC 7305]|uniref:hypothetical protein n=1 Tax=Xenococcus sp. PCC 7305 TaxID=102125 RepID=UPI0002AC0EF2|nr:hypothetical protein [Xenococcus sp. PCC 7305]ELS02584.1 hypothetical protein Xen7305DRAFT_00022990 [Xenococcus sp. PCC 7305]
MDSEDRQNPLSKSKTVDQLRTAIKKLETIIEQLNSTSVVDLPSTNAVETLITTTEELESLLANLPEETVAPEAEMTPVDIEANGVAEIQPEVIPSPAQEKATASKVEISESENLVSQIPISKIPEEPESLNQEIAPETPAKSPKKTPKARKKRNWIAIAIIAIIVAIIPISLKYLSPGITEQISPAETTEIIREESPLIANNLTENKLQNEAIIVTKEVKEGPKSTVTEQISQQPATENREVTTNALAAKSIAQEPSAPSDVLLAPESEEAANLVTENILDPEVATESKAMSQSNPETVLPNAQIETKIATDISTAEEFSERENTSATNPSSNTEKIIDKKLDPTATSEIDRIPENISEPEPNILIPETLVSEFAEEKLDVKTIIHDVKLTPEQNLIALLSHKVLELSEGYQEDLVLSLEPNITSNVLTVRIADDWYQLETTEQDEIVSDMFLRSQNLEFRKLVIKDNNDNLVARSPVVGQNMIIFRRHSNNNITS